MLFSNLSAKEYSFNCHGLNFLCILGKHVNGGFCAIINWGVAAELSEFKNDFTYNSRRILEALECSRFANWLPSDEEARSAVARDLAIMVTQRIGEL